MAVNYAENYAGLVDERFTLGSLTAEAVNENYSWAGVQTVRVYRIPTAPMQDYNRQGAARYGAAQELGNEVQEMRIKRDRAFTFSIDRGNHDETQMSSDAGQALRRQLEEVVLPEIDRYRLAAMAAGAGLYGKGNITPTKTYEALLQADEAMASKGVPNFGRVAFVSPAVYKNIKLDNAFVRQGDESQEMLVTGVVGMVDNVRIVRVPSGYLPENVDFIIVHPDAVVAPNKLAEYKIHDNPPGINGWLVEGRVCYDAFVSAAKKEGIYLHANALGALAAEVLPGGTGMTKLIVPGMGGADIVYSVGGTMPTFEDDLSAWSKVPADGLIAASAGDTVHVAALIDGLAVLATELLAVN